MTKLEEAIKKFPVVVQEQITDGLTKAGIVELSRLEIILPVLSKAIQVSKPTGSVAGDGEYNITVVDPKTSKVLVRESDEKMFTIADFINTFNFDSKNTDQRPTMTWDEAGTPSGDEMEDIAEGRTRVLSPQKVKPAKGAIPASQIERGHRGSFSVEEIASGKQVVDMDK